MSDARGHLGRRRSTLGLWAAAGVGALWPATARPARVVFVRMAGGGMVAMNVGDSAEDRSGGFMTRKQPAAVTDALDDFERYRDHKVWEKAFTALDKVGSAAADRLVVAADGVAIPVPLKVRRELLSLPPEGRQAYRLFNDAKARKLLAAAVTPPKDPSAPPADDVALLRQVVDQYFVTSVGDQAADRLGDALYEAGDPTAADAYWRLVVDDFPDTTLSLAQVQVKRAVALADAGEADAFDAVRSTVHDRYAAQAVTVAGRAVAAGPFVDGLAARAHRAAAAPTVAQDGPPLALPAADAGPLWQVPLMDADTAKQLEARMANYGWGRLAGQLLSSVPPVAADGKRVYVNWYGATIAADLTTGKLLWRTSSPAAMVDGMVQGMSNGNAIDPDGYALRPVGADRLLVVGRPPPAPNNNGQPANAVLACLSADTGKVLWSTKDGPLKAWTFVGPPLPDGDAVHAVAIDTGAAPSAEDNNGNANGNGNVVVNGNVVPNGNGNPKQEYTLLTIALADGAVRSKVLLGTPQFPSDNFRGNPMVRPPVLLARAGRVLVLTNDGALLSVDPKAPRLEWAYSFKPRAEQQEYYYGYAVSPPPTGRANLLLAGATLYLKEYGSTAMYALDLAGAAAGGPTLRWRRPADGDAGLVSLRGGDVLMLGASADAIDLDTLDMRWSNALTMGTGDARPLVAAGRMYVFSRRGVQAVDLADGADAGPIFRGADRDSDGGPLLRVGVGTDHPLLLTVSAKAVTAYPLAPAAGGH